MLNNWRNLVWSIIPMGTLIFALFLIFLLSIRPASALELGVGMTTDQEAVGYVAHEITFIRVAITGVDTPGNNALIPSLGIQILGVGFHTGFAFRGDDDSDNVIGFSTTMPLFWKLNFRTVADWATHKNWTMLRAQIGMRF